MRKYYFSSIRLRSSKALFTLVVYIDFCVVEVWRHDLVKCERKFNIALIELLNVKKVNPTEIHRLLKTIYCYYTVDRSI